MLKRTQSARPTFDPARGKELPKGPAYHQRLLPAHTKLKTRQPGQGGDADREIRDLRAELLAAEAAARAKAKGGLPTHPPPASEPPSSNKRLIGETGDNDGAPEDEEAKRRKILEETRDIDADSDGGGSGDSDSSSEDDSDDDEEDETAELLRELEKIKRERAEQREKEVRLLVCLLFSRRTCD